MNKPTPLRHPAPPVPGPVAAFGAGRLPDRSASDSATITTREASARLGVSVRTVQLWVEEGRLDAWKTPGGHRRVYVRSVEQMLGEDGTPATLAEPGQDALRILVVEDNPVALRMLAIAIAGLPYAVRLSVAANGFEGLLVAGRERPDLVITDLMMPEMNGVQMIRALLRDPQFADLRVVVVTALDAAQVDELGPLPAGVTVLRKPVGIGAISAIAEACRRERGNRGARRMHEEPLS